MIILIFVTLHKDLQGSPETCMPFTSYTLFGSKYLSLAICTLIKEFEI